MKRPIILLSAALFTLFLTLTATAGDKLLVSGCGIRDLNIIDKKTKTIEWTHRLAPGEECNDAEITKKGEVLYAYKKGARLITRKEQAVVWDFRALPGEEVFTATQLKNGNYIVAACGHPSRIIELNTKGDTVRIIRFDTGIKSVHGQFRQVLPTPRGTFLIALMAKGEVIEMDDKGTVLKRVAVGGSPFSVKIIKNGNWLVGCGDGHTIKEIDPVAQQVVSTIDNSVLTETQLLFVAEVTRLKNGHTLIANWEGHTKDTVQYKIIEIDQKNKVVWGIRDCKIANRTATLFQFKK